MVKALTGCDTDTLAEEKKRGILINLGFASFQLPNGRTIGIVDVPGHEKFIKNMLAGATGIDLALIVLTKIDMVEEEFKELVVEDIRGFFLKPPVNSIRSNLTHLAFIRTVFTAFPGKRSNLKT